MIWTWVASALLAANVAPRLAVAGEPAIAGAERVAAVVPSSALDDYVAKPDANYGWKLRSRMEVAGVDVVELILTSQTWRGIEWKHQLLVCLPKQAKNPSQAMMLITGGGWKDELDNPPEGGKPKLPTEALLLAGIVNRVGSPVAILSHVPFQPIFDGKVEDQIIAYTFAEYLKDQDPEWPLLLPMTKSAVRAMDAVQEFVKEETGLSVENFTVTGGSKRGWTTWLTGAVDPRVNAIAPIVIDVLNMQPQMEHQLATWGKYSEMIDDYTRNGIQLAADSPVGRKLNEIVDPYSYRERLTQPKLIVIATNDRYWPLDALNIYWDDLIGPKYVMYVPNHGHGVADVARLTGSISSLHRMASGELPFPQLEWNLEETGDKLSLSMNADIKPKQVVAWLATSETKDFRDSKWKSYPAERGSDGYTYEIDVPSSGYAAMFGEAVFDHGGLNGYFSTNVKIVGGGGSADAGGE